MDIINTVISLFVLLFAITIHEASHAWTAQKKGDPTAAAMGRVSLNPLAHIDPFGTVLFPLILVLLHFPAFGWAKPVQVNPFNLRNPRRDGLWISLAGPASNLLVASASILLIVLIKLIRPGVGLYLREFLLNRASLPRGIFPLEGLVVVLFFACQINVYLAIFNLIPVPPLDGSGILYGLLSPAMAQTYDKIRPYGIFIVLFLVYMGVLNMIVQPINMLIYAVIFF